MLKRVDVGIYEYLESFVDGHGRGWCRQLRPEGDGVGYATSGGFVDDIKAELDGYADKIMSGKIKVPTTP